MLYLGLDQHAKQLTVNLHDHNGDVVLRRHVSTRPNEAIEFFEQLARRCAEKGAGFWAVVEVCGFNDWLLEMLKNFRSDWITKAGSSLAGWVLGQASKHILGTGPAMRAWLK